MSLTFGISLSFPIIEFDTIFDIIQNMNIKSYFFLFFLISKNDIYIYIYIYTHKRLLYAAAAIQEKLPLKPYLIAEAVSSATAAQTLCSNSLAVASSLHARSRSTCTWYARLLGRILEFCS